MAKARAYKLRSKRLRGKPLGTTRGAPYGPPEPVRERLATVDAGTAYRYGFGNAFAVSSGHVRALFLVRTLDFTGNYPVQESLLI